MPSGEPAPAPSRHDRNLESLGGSTRLELGLGGVARVVRRRGLCCSCSSSVSRSLAIYAGSSLLPKRYSSVAWIKITDQTPEPLRQDRQLGRPHQGAERGRPHARVAAAQRRRSRRTLGATVQGRQVGARHRARGVAADPRRHVGDLARGRGEGRRTPRPRSPSTTARPRCRRSSPTTPRSSTHDQRPRPGSAAKSERRERRLAAAPDDVARSVPALDRAAGGAGPGVHSDAAAAASRRTPTR